jgi:hypothetical protein
VPSLFAKSDTNAFHRPQGVERWTILFGCVGVLHFTILILCYGTSSSIRAAFMSIRAHLDGHKFDGETIRQMGIAFELALASLHATPVCDDPIRTALAQRIIALAKAGECDPERLCEAALSVVSSADPSGGPKGDQMAER